MYFTDDSLLPENQAPLMITASPYGPVWMPVDCTPEQKLPVTGTNRSRLRWTVITRVQRCCTSMYAIPRPVTFQRTSSSTTTRSGDCAMLCRR